MKRIQGLGIAALLFAMLLSPPGFPATNTALEAALSHDGLAKVSVKGLDLAFTRPGASLAGYNAVMLDPVEVAFHKDWDPKRAGSRLRLSSDDRERIRTGVAKIVQEEYAKELQAKGSYRVVAQPGPDVLRVRLSVVNLYVNAPDVGSVGRTRTYTVSAGEMTLFAEVFDSETGQVLARVVDRREGRSTGMMQLSSSMVNAAEARDVASSWARILRSALDKAHGIERK